MAGGTHSQGALTEMLIEPGSSTHTFDSNSLRFEILQFTPTHNRRMIGGHGNWGTLERPKERTREGAGTYSGEISMYVSPNALDKLLDDVFGMADTVGASSTTWDLQDISPPYFGMLLDMDQGVFEYQDTMLDFWELSAQAPSEGSRGEPDMVILTLGVKYSDELGPNAASPPSWPGTPPSKVYAANDAPYVFSDTDAGITLFGATRPMQSLRIRQDNFLQSKYTNSLNPHSIRSRRRLIRVAGQLPWNSVTEDLHHTAVAGASASVVFTNGTMSTTLNFANLETDGRQSPLIRGKEEVGFTIQGYANSSGDIATASNRALQIINDHTA